MATDPSLPDPAESPTLQPPAGASNTWAGGLPGQLPTRLGRYELRRLLGKGGMGAVFLAHDPQLDRAVALKIPVFGPDDDATARERFFREAKAAATLRHPNVCPVYDVGVVDGIHFLTMAFIEGEPLTARVAGLANGPPQQALKLVRILAQTLQEAHERGIIHRDLKPANIMIDRRGQPIVMDFGLARRTAAPDTRLTQDHSVLGTPAYMAPEQARGEVAAMGPLCDVYSLGVVLYELLSGTVPFLGDAMTVLVQVVRAEPAPPSRHRPDLDPALDALCLKAMAKAPADRYPSMKAFAAAIAAYLHDQTDPILAPPEGAAPQAGPAARRPVLPWLAGLAALVVVGLGALFWPGGGDQGANPPPAATQVAAAIRPAPATPTAAAPAPTKPAAPPAPLPPWPAALKEGKVPAPSLTTAAARVLVDHDFKEARQRPPATQGAEEKTGATRGYANGLYFIRVPSGRWAFGLSHPDLPGDFAVQVVGRWAGGTAGGWDLTLRTGRGGGPDHHLMVALRSDGKVSVGPTPTDPDKAAVPKVGPLAHPAIKPVAEFNTLLVIAHGKVLEVYVNGAAVCDPLPADFPLAPAHLLLGAAGQRTTKEQQAEFQRVTVWSAEGVSALEERRGKWPR